MDGFDLGWVRVSCVLAFAAVSCVGDRGPQPDAVRLPVVQPVTAPPRAVAAPDRVSAAPRVAREQAGLLDSGELIVGHREGLEAWLPDGSTHRTISAGTALHPRRFGHDHVVVLREPDVRDGAVLELVSLADGQRRELAQLPPFRCAGQGASKPARLLVMEPESFEVDSAERVACLEVADGSVASATVRLRVRVELATGELKRWLAFGDADCAVPEGVKVGEPASDRVCWRMVEVAREQPDPTRYPYSFENEHVRSPAAKSGARKLQVRGYELESISPSHRWLLLAGEYTERETTYRRLLLLDRSGGSLFPVADRVGPWPAPLSASGAKLTVPVKQAPLISSVVDVRWLGTREDNEVLVLDNVIIKPGQPAFQIVDAELAR